MTEPAAEPLTDPTHAGMAVYAVDTGRILMIQRSLDPTDPPEVQGTWEFPGGTIEEGEDSLTAAWREFSEETGLAPPEEGEIRGSWLSKDGIYEGFVYKVPVEAEAFAELNPDLAAAEAINPDDPQRRMPDVSAWFTIEQIKGLGSALRPEVALTDWSVFTGGGPMTETPPEAELEAIMRGRGMSFSEIATLRLAAAPMPDEEPVDEVPIEADPIPTEPVNDQGGRPASTPEQAVPFHVMIAAEDVKTGDGRRFMPNSLSNRPLPLPLGWQKFTASEHNNSVVTGRIEKMKMADVVHEGVPMRAQVGSGHFIMAAEADEFIGLLGEFGRFGLSVDADDAVGTINEADECVDFSQARTCGATAVPIPALHQSWISIGEPPADWGLDQPDEQVAELDPPPALVAGAGMVLMKDLAPGKTEDGPGWLTHPVDTDRLRDYWVHGEGAAKIGWGTPGDFNRCRVAVGKYIEPQYLAGYCANRHYDALGFWPGRPLSGETIPFAAETLHLENTEPAPSMTLTASAYNEIVAPAEWFADPKWSIDDERMVEFEPGKYAVPFTVTSEGQIYGHIAARGTCHINPAFDYCVEPPVSMTNYGYFRTGAVLLDNGEQAATGVISIGGGHAGERLSARQALAHYDNTSTACADVACYDDEFGIAVAGWVRPGTSPEQVAALRASKISGDWRPWGPYPLEMVAALAVNVPGFGVPRVRIAASSHGQLSLVAAGLSVPMADEAIKSLETLDIDALSFRIAGQVAEILERKQELAAMAAARQEGANDGVRV